MKKIVTTILSLALVVSASSLLAQQAPAPAKVQPVNVAQGQPLVAGTALTTGIAVTAVVAVGMAATAGDSGDNPVVTPAASGTR